jgi:hypothetical protein
VGVSVNLEERDAVDEQPLGQEYTGDEEDDGDTLFVDIDGVPTAQLRPRKVYDYYTTVLGGLEAVAEKDLRYHLKGLSKIRVDREGGRQSRLFFRYERSPKQLLEIRSVERIMALIGIVGRITVGKPGLFRLAERILEADLASAVVLHDILHGEKEEARFGLACTVSGDHRFSSSEVYQIVQTVLEAKYDVIPEGEGAPYRLHLQVMGRRAVFGLELASPLPADHGVRVPRSLAYCLGLMAKVEERDVCLDPYPVDGSLMRHVGELFGPKQVFQGVEEEGPEDGTVDRILTIPMSRDVAGNEEEMLKGFARALAPRRTATVLVEDRKALEEAAGRAPFEIMMKTPVRLRGRAHTAVVLRKKE